MRILFLLPFFSLFGAVRCGHSFSVAAGAFDFLRDKYRTAEFSMECKFYAKSLPSTRYLDIRPLIGVMSTIEGSGYLYSGINFDLLFFDHVLIAPGFAAGYYWKGHGKDLGYPLEFRSGVEVAWQWGNRYRFGVHFYHLSNAHLGRRNPGEESLIAFYEIPI